MDICSDEIKKQDIIDRFNSRPKVQTYIINLNVGKSINLDGEWLNDIEGVGEEIKEDLNDLFELYGLKANYVYEDKQITHGSWWYDMTPLQGMDIDRYLPIFFIEFSLYPVSYLRKSTLNNIYFCNSLTFSTESYSQYRASVPDYWYNMKAMIYCCKETSSSYVRNVIHHEFFHFVDYIEDGKIYGSEPKWEACNKPGFQYGTGGANNRVWKPFDEKDTGFLNYYSTTGIEEDKAEIFAYMMTDPEYVINPANEYLNAKFNYMREMMFSFDSEGLGKQEFWDFILQFRNNTFNC